MSEDEKGLFVDDPVIERIAFLVIMALVVGLWAGALLRGLTVRYTEDDLLRAAEVTEASLYVEKVKMFYSGYHAACVILEQIKGGNTQSGALDLCIAFTDAAVELDAFGSVTGISPPQPNALQP